MRTPELEKIAGEAEEGEGEEDGGGKEDSWFDIDKKAMFIPLHFCSALTHDNLNESFFHF